MEREMEQELEWLEAQKILITVDILAAAKQQLQFLAAVDKNRCLYEGPALERAIYRYNACWLPLLAKYSESPISEGPLVVPLDCEWVWHCHRLNPVRYKSDCEELYGRILDNDNVVSSIKGSFRGQTEEIWNRMCPNEPYDIDLTRAFSEATNKKFSTLGKYSEYDLVSAVKRQSPFFYQVSGPHMNNDIFLEEAVARYKGFLYLIKRNKERSMKRFCVPTYDIDLIWHTHQLHPVSYCKDLNEALGKILEHDDTDSDRTKGKKLDVGFSGTTKQWEETFGTRYRKAGAMYRGSAPSPLTTIPFQSNISSNELPTLNECQKIIQLPEFKIVEVILEIVGVKNIPEGHKGSLFVTFSKKQPDAFFNTTRKLTILSESGKKQVAYFQCEPKGELFFELVSSSPSNLALTKAIKPMGVTSLSLQDFLCPVSKLAVEKWVELVPVSVNVSSKPVYLRIAVSFTVPVQAPLLVQMICSRPLSNNSCFLGLPGRIQHAKTWAHIVDGDQTEVINLQMRDSTKAKDKSMLKKQVIAVMKSAETVVLAELVGMQWYLMDSHWSLQHKMESSEDIHLFELVGCRTVKIFLGRKLDFEPKHCKKQRNEQDFMTAVEFSAEDPYGKAVALFDMKSGFVEVKEEWLVLPGIITAFILSDISKKERNDGFLVKTRNLKDVDGVAEKNGSYEEPNQTSLTPSAESRVENASVAEGNVMKSGDCCADDGVGGCGNMVKSGGCGGCGAGGGKNTMKSGGCGGCGAGGCGGGCGSMVKSGGCGGCGAGGCGGMVKSGGCGGCGAGGCGSMVKSGGCGGCGTGGCGSIMKIGGCGGCGAVSCGSRVTGNV